MITQNLAQNLAQNLRDLVELAAQDLALTLEGNLRHQGLPVRVELRTWGDIIGNQCLACLAGAVFLRQKGYLFKWDSTEEYGPYYDAMLFLDGLRFPNSC